MTITHAESAEGFRFGRWKASPSDLGLAALAGGLAQDTVDELAARPPGAAAVAEEARALALQV